MTSYVALLRAVNLGAHGKVAMSDLRVWAEELGFLDVRTLLQSGNLVFRSEKKTSSAELERLFEAESPKGLGLKTEFMVRSDKDWSKLVAANPFPNEAKSDPSHLVVMFMKNEPRAAAVTALQEAIKGRELIHAKGRELFVTYPDGIGRSKLTNVVMERKLATRATGRNWNTVLKIADLLRD